MCKSLYLSINSPASFLEIQHVSFYCFFCTDIMSLIHSHILSFCLHLAVANLLILARIICLAVFMKFFNNIVCSSFEKQKSHSAATRVVHVCNRLHAEISPL